MSLLNQQQQAAIEAYLDEQGLTFLPLRNEMTDHLICDIESYIDRGYSFEEAWQLTTNEISGSHFRNLQTETMEATSKKLNLSRSFTFLSLALLAIASVFKLLHWQYSSVLLMGSFGSMIAALVISAVSGTRLHKQKKGRLMLAGVVLGVILFLISWCMQVLHLPGSVPLRVFSALLLLVLFPVLMVHARTKGNDDLNILTYLHEKNTPDINRFFVLLLAIGSALKLTLIALGYEASIPNVLLALVIGGAGLQFFALHWHHKTGTMASAKDYTILVALIVGFVAFMIPTLTFNEISVSPSTKVMAAAVFNLAAGAVVVIESDKKITSLPLVLGSWIIIGVWAAASLGYADEAVRDILFSVPVLIALAGGLVVSSKRHTLLAFTMTVAAHFMFFY